MIPICVATNPIKIVRASKAIKLSCESLFDVYEVIRKDYVKIFLVLTKLKCDEGLIEFVKEFMNFAKISEETSYVITHYNSRYHIIFNVWTKLETLKELVRSFISSSCSELTKHLTCMQYSKGGMVQLPGKYFEIYYWSDSRSYAIEEFKKLARLKEKAKEHYTYNTLSLTLEIRNRLKHDEKIEAALRKEDREYAELVRIYEKEMIELTKITANAYKMGIIQMIDDATEYHNPELAC